VGLDFLPSAAAADQPVDALTKAGEPVGSYEVAPVHILGVPAISVASPVVSQQDAGPQATQRAAVIEGNLSLLYQPRLLCDQGEAIAEALLEGLVLGGPQKQRLCSGDPWSVQIDAYLAADLAGRVRRITPLRISHHSARGISTTRGSQRNSAR
jgi:hypothetical protein